MLWTMLERLIVAHVRLLKKLRGYGVTKQISKWLRSSLNDRKQKVVVNAMESQWASVLSGVPQGSKI